MNNCLDSYKDAYSPSSLYTLDNKLMLNWYTDRIIELTRGCENLLELGIGHGYSSVKLSQAFKRHLVLEGSQQIIEEFKNKVHDKKIEIEHIFFEDFLSAEKFDVIVMGFILEHVEDPVLIAKKYKEFLKPGGKIYVTVPNSEALNKRIGYEAGILEDMSALSPADLAFGHRRLFTVQSLKDLMESVGYKVNIIEGIFLKPITTQQITDLNLDENVLRGMLQVGKAYPELCVGILMEVEVVSNKF